MGDVLNVKDQAGRPVRLSDERWRHIRTSHVDVTLDAIEWALARPSASLPSDRDPDVRWILRFDRRRTEYLLVCVKYKNMEGFIITAFYTDSLPK